MAKEISKTNQVILGQRPKTFKPVIVKFELPEGGEAAIEIRFKYRTRTEFGEFIDGMFGDAGEVRPADEKFSMRDLMQKTRDKNATYLAGCIDSWSLEEDLSDPTLCQFSDELPAGAIAIMEAYRTAALEGRLGN